MTRVAENARPKKPPAPAQSPRAGTAQPSRAATVPPEPSRVAAPADAEILRVLVEGTAFETGTDFFRSLVRNLAGAMQTNFAFIAEFCGPERVRTIAYWWRDGFLDPVEWDLAGTPCEEVVKGELCHYPTGVARLFPRDTPLAENGIESYLGVPLVAASGQHLGHLAVFDDKPMPPGGRQLDIFRIFAARAAAELERLRFEERLADSERRFRDLYDHAPIAYIYEDTESRFVSANRAACQLLGIAPEEVTGTIGKTLLAPTPETHETIRRALEAIQTQGKEFAGVELELRRKDNGQPVWVQWYSKPEPDGRHTRTMLIDITQRVLAEQEKARLEQQNLYLREEIKQVHNFEEIVGQSRALLEVLEGVGRVAPTDASVLIQGETGSGKELIARAIHNASKRRDKPLIKLNCAALPVSLVESELFGHERGAFTGATQRRIGRFELAHGGTIFLDEIGEMPLETQAKLLRVLQERELERLGASQPIKVDVRVIAATNRDLKKAVRDGTFREDLFYRLSVFPVSLPPLRQRREDIPLLIQYLLARACNRVGKRIEGVTKTTMDRLVAYPWPGNVRELENLLERAVILASGPILDIELAPPPTETPQGESADGPAGSHAPVVTLDQLERQHVEAVLKRTNWVIDGDRGAAKILGLHPNTLRSRLKKMGLERRAHEAS